MAAQHDEPYGLEFGAAVPARELREGQIVVLDGHVIAVAPDPDDPDSVRLSLVCALGPPPGNNPDQREVELVCPRDMVFATAAPHNIDLAPLPTST
jgi:hypothetical protein